MWLAGVGGIYGCGCKDVYRFPHSTYPYSSCICSFFTAASLLFKCFSFFKTSIREDSLIEMMEYLIDNIYILK